MAIDRVTYAKLFNLGDYQNERIEAEAPVGAGETPEQTLAAIREWVEMEHTAFGIARDEQVAHVRTREMREEEISALEVDIKRMRQAWEKHKALLEKAGVDLPALWSSKGLSDDDIPF